MAALGDDKISKLYKLFSDEEYYQDQIKYLTKEIMYFSSLSDKQFATLESQKRLWAIPKNLKCHILSNFGATAHVTDNSLVESLVMLRRQHDLFEEGQVCPDKIHEIISNVSAKMCEAKKNNKYQWSVLAVFSAISYKMTISASSVKHADALNRLLVDMPMGDTIYFMTLCRNVLLSAIGPAKDVRDHASRYFFFRFLALNASSISADIDKFYESIDPAW